MRTIELTMPDSPEFPGSEENLRCIRDALTANPRAREHQGMSIIRIATGNQSWIGDGDHGWRADLWIRPLEPIRQVLWNLANWWEDAVREAVRECPAPEEGTPQHHTYRGVPRIKRTLWWKYQAGGNITATGAELNSVRIEAMIQWNGRAVVRDTLWPFDLARVTGQIPRALEAALGDIWTDAWEENTTSAARSRRA